MLYFVINKSIETKNPIKPTKTDFVIFEYLIEFLIINLIWINKPIKSRFNKLIGFRPRI